MAKRTRPYIEKIDARTTRKDRSRQAIVQAYLELVNETRRQPTALQIATRAGCSLRLIFQHFSDLPSLTFAAAQYGYEQGHANFDVGLAEGNRPARIRAQIERRAGNCEAWLPLWRVALAQQDQSADLRRVIGCVREAAVDRLKLMYEPELSVLSEIDRQRLLLALEAITDFESWGRLRDEHGLSVEEATASWMAIVDRLLPPTPANWRAAARRPADASDPAVSRSTGQSLHGSEIPIAF